MAMGGGGVHFLLSAECRACDLRGQVGLYRVVADGLGGGISVPAQGGQIVTLSVIITTFNNARTLAYCLESVKWADEIVLLDSFSTDDTMRIAAQYGCVTMQHTFLGYGRQKQLALNHATHPWVLLLDADEALSPEAQHEIRTLLEGVPDRDGYTLPRLEQQFWRMCHPKVRINRFLRLFQREKTHFSEMPVHAAPQVNGRIGKLKSVFYPFG